MLDVTEQVYGRVCAQLILRSLRVDPHGWSIHLTNPPYAGIRYGIGVFVQCSCISIAYLDSSLVIVALDGRDVVADGAM